MNGTSLTIVAFSEYFPFMSGVSAGSLFDRRSLFGYSCSRCRVCCRDKTIHLNPYEIARLAKNRGISTTAFIERFTVNGGTILKYRQDGTCVFLDPEGCAVHADRPLVCRLYPLGRRVDFLGVEEFFLMELEDSCRGVFHKNGTVEKYLEEQETAVFMRAADLYLGLLWNLLEEIREQQLDPVQYETVLGRIGTVMDDTTSDHDLSWIDMDRALALYCGQSGLAVPANLEDRMKMHIKAVRTWTE